MCVYCATGAADVLAEPGGCKADVAVSVGEQAGDGMVEEALRDEMQRLTENFDRMAGVGGQVGGRPY